MVRASGAGEDRSQDGLLLHQLWFAHDPNVDERTRLRWFGFIAETHFALPVYRQRWDVVQAAARARAAVVQSTPEIELFRSTVNALAMIRPESLVTSVVWPLERVLRRDVANLVTEDFLGPHWRDVLRRSKYRPTISRGEEEAVAFDSQEHADRLMAEAAATLPDVAPLPEDEERARRERFLFDRQYHSEVLKAAKLSTLELDLLSARFSDPSFTVADWARSRNLAPSSGRTLLERARAKLMRAMRLPAVR